MIVRKILDDPEKVTSRFDWFNDYLDTAQWLMNLPADTPGRDAALKAIEKHCPYINGGYH